MAKRFYVKAIVHTPILVRFALPADDEAQAREKARSLIASGVLLYDYNGDRIEIMRHEDITITECTDVRP